MKLTTLFTALRNATSDIWRMHDFDYQLPKDLRKIIGKKNAKITQLALIAKFTNPISRSSETN